jgi:nicotinic acid phosphoribosyltransferase
MRNIRSILITGAAVGAAAIGGGAIANAATSTSTPSSSSSSPAAPATGQAPRAFNGPAHGTAAHENAEKTVTGAAAAQAQAAAVKSVGSGTAGAVTSDYTGSGYETTVTKADGTTVEVHLDSSYNVMQGPGGPGGHGGPAPAGMSG